MGLFGALIVATGAGRRTTSTTGPTRSSTRTTEFMLLLSEIDPYLNAKVLKGTSAFNMNNYHPRYWLINGRQFPDSIADNFASWLPSQPYGALATIHPYDAGTNPLPGGGPLPERRHDGLPVPPARQQRQGHRPRRHAARGGRRRRTCRFDKFAVNIGPGQTWDVLFDWKDDEDYSPTNPVPASEPDLQNLTIGMFYGGSPYLGVTRSRCRPASRPSTSAASSTSSPTTTRSISSRPGA